MMAIIDRRELSPMSSPTMYPRLIGFLLVCTIVLLLVLIALEIAGRAQVPASAITNRTLSSAPARAHASAQTRAHATSLEFVPNRGQLADQFRKPMPEVLYSLDGHGVKFYFTKSGFHYVFGKYPKHGPITGRPTPHALDSMAHADSVMLYRVDVSFEHANANPRIEVMDSSASFYNFYLPQCPDGITKVPSYHTLVYRELYPHIDMVVRARREAQATMEYDFIVHPGGDPSAIQLRYNHADSLVLSKSGRLRFVTPYGEMIEERPSSYQSAGDAQSHAIASRFVLSGNTLRFAVDRYDRSRDLTIDPPRLWGTYFGGTGSEFTYTLGVDRHNNVEIAGYTNSTSGIATAGAFQTTLNAGATNSYIASFGPQGNLRWATYYGGNVYDILYRCACDSSCGVVVAGWTESTTGLASPGAYQTTFGGGTLDGFIASFDSTGVRNWGTWFGGPGYDYCWGVAVDSSGNIVVGGLTESTTGIATAGAYQTSLLGGEDAFITKFTPGGAILWSTYYGGSGADGWARVSCDKANNIYSSISTGSAGMATPGAWQTAQAPALLSKFTSAGQLIWATYYYPTSTIYDIACGRAGNLYFCGYDNLPGEASPGAYQTSPAGSYDGVLGRFDSSGQRVWCTYYGGPANDYLYTVGVDTNENVLAAGYTNSTSGIACPGEYQTSFLGSTVDPFMVKFDSSGTRRWATYYGQEGYIYGISIDRFGHPAVGGYSSTTTNVFASPGAYLGTPPGDGDAFVARFCDTLEVLVFATPSKFVCPGTSVVLTSGAGLASYQWSLNGTLIPGATSPTYVVPGTQLPGTYFYSVTGPPANSNVCEAGSYPVKIVRGGATLKMASIPSICRGDSVQLLDTISGTAPLHYSWSPATGLDHPDSARPMASPTTTTIYTLSVTDSVGCVTTANATVTVNPLATVSAGGNQTLCRGSIIKLTAVTSGGTGPFRYQWSPGTGLDRTDSSTVVSSTGSTMKYVVTVTDKSGCIVQDSMLVMVVAPPVLSAGPPLSICPGSSIKIGATISGGTPKSIQWSPATGLNDPTIQQPIASPSATTLYRVIVTSIAGCIVSDSVLVTVSDSLSPTVIASGPLTICTGDTTRLSAASGYSSYMWSSGDKSLSISVTKSGDYSVRVTSNGGCGGTSKAVHVTVLPDSVPRPALQAARTVLCAGDSITVSPTQSYQSYRWSTGDTTPSIVVSKAGAYSVTVANSAGCSGTSAPVTFTILPRPSAQLAASGATSFCDGDSVTLRATPGYHYAWWNGATKLPDTTQTIIVKTSGSFTVNATNDAGCDTSSAPVTITVKPMPSVSIAGPSSNCIGGIAGYRIHSPVGSTVLWQTNPASLGAITTGQGTDSITIQWGTAATGTIEVVVTSDGCAGTASLPVTIDAHLTPLVTPSGALAFCEGDSVTLDAGAGYASYRWSKDGTAIPNDSSETLTTGQTGIFTVDVTAASGCSGTSQSTVVTVFPAPPKPVISVAGQLLTATSSSRYSWQRNGASLPHDTTQSITADSAGSYVVTIADVHGCSRSSDPIAFTPDAGSVELSLGSIQAYSGNHITLPLTLVASHGLTSGVDFTYTIRFNRSLLGIVDPSAISSVAGDERSLTRHATISNQLSADPVDQIEFIAALGDTSETPIYIDTVIWAGVGAAGTTPIATKLDSGHFTLLGVCPAGGNRFFSEDGQVLLHSIIPNPIGDIGVLEYSLAEPGETSLRIVDMLGRTATVLVSGNAEPGSYRAVVNATHLSSGIYSIVLRTPSQVFSTRMEVYH